MRTKLIGYLLNNQLTKLYRKTIKPRFRLYLIFRLTSLTSLISKLSTAELVKLENSIFFPKLAKIAMSETIVVVFPVPG